MPHADASALPDTVRTKRDLWAHVHEQLHSLFEGQRNWVSNLANASALIYHSLRAFSPVFGDGDAAVNWTGFYLEARLFPTPRVTRIDENDALSKGQSRLLLGPFCGKPACQFINTTPGKARGVCADAYLQRRTLLVPDVDAYPGHIACDGETKSELVCPLLSGDVVVGVLDLDCLARDAFDEVDREGVEEIAKLIVDSCDW